MKLKKLTATFLAISMTFASVNVTFGDGSETDFVYDADYDNGQVTISFDESTGTITHIDPKDYSVVVDLDIPSEINGVTVTSIGDYAYSYRNNLGTITLPNTVTTIGMMSFGRANFDSIVLPDSLVSIGEYAFNGWYGQTVSQTTITIPSSVSDIGENALGGDMQLGGGECAAIYVNEGNKYYSSLNGILSNKDLTEIITYPPGKTDSSYTIPDGVLSIGAYAFSACYSLTDVTIPKNVTSIDTCAFIDAGGLKTVYCYKNSTADNTSLYPDGVTIIYLDSDESTTETTTKNTETSTTTTSTETTTETTTTAADSTTETTTAVRHTGGGGGGSSSVSATTTTTTTTEATTETTTDVIETTTEATTASVISNDVNVSIGSNTVVVGDNSYTIDAAPYIQASSNSTLVPLRFVAIAILGDDIENADDSSIIDWNAATKTASITANGNVIQFTANSNIMNINGNPVAMDNGVIAEITDGRMYIPFRALGNALGVDVYWDSDTKTAIYKTM